ncbi:MAG: flagellar brake protein [Peptococcaceae bacterium]|nr:flagellar brake protein [Peptococcaceae bacterium]
MKKLFSVNQLVEVEPLNEDWAGSYKTRLEDINEDLLIFGVPYVNGGLLPLRVNDEIVIRVCNKTAMFKFNAKVKTVIRGDLPLFAVDIPAECVKVQRREFVRIDVSIPLRYRDKPEAEFIKAHSLDVSGGGVRFAADKNLAIGTKLEMVLDFLGDFSITTRVEVLRSVEADARQYHISARFYELEHSLADKILQWTFKYQLSLRRKGLI